MECIPWEQNLVNLSEITMQVQPLQNVWDEVKKKSQQERQN